MYTFFRRFFKISFIIDIQTFALGLGLSVLKDFWFVHFSVFLDFLKYTQIYHFDPYTTFVFSRVFFTFFLWIPEAGSIFWDLIKFDECA